MGSMARSTSAAGSRNLAHFIVVVILIFVVVIVVIVVIFVLVFVVPLVVVGIANALFCKEV